jgi:hypothetical protein
MPVNPSHVDFTPISGAHFGMQINNEWRGVAYCHNRVRYDVSSFHDKVYTIIPRDVEWLKLHAKNFLTWFKFEPFFRDFLDPEQTLEEIFVTRTIASVVGNNSLSYTYVCFQFLRSFFQGSYTLECWNKIMDSNLNVDPLVLLSALMILRPEPERLAVYNDRGLIDGHMPFPYAMDPLGGKIRSVLRCVKERYAPTNQGGLLRETTEHRIKVNSWFARESAEDSFLYQQHSFLSSTPYNWLELTSVNNNYPELPWSSLVNLHLNKVNPNGESFLNPKAIEELSA